MRDGVVPATIRARLAEVDRMSVAAAAAIDHALESDTSWLRYGCAARWQPPIVGKSYAHEMDGWVDVTGPGVDRYDGGPVFAGASGAVWVPAVADVAAPTVAELTRGADVSFAVVDETVGWVPPWSNPGHDVLADIERYAFPQRLILGFDGSNDSDMAVIAARMRDDGVMEVRSLTDVMRSVLREALKRIAAEVARHLAPTPQPAPRPTSYTGCFTVSIETDDGRIIPATRPVDVMGLLADDATTAGTPIYDDADYALEQHRVQLVATRDTDPVRLPSSVSRGRAYPTSTPPWSRGRA